MKTINVNDEQYQVLKELSYLMKTQDNRATSYPVFSVQTQRSRAAADDYENVDGYQLIWEGETATDVCDDIDKLKKEIRKHFIERGDRVNWNDDLDCIYSFKEADSIHYLQEWLNELSKRKYNNTSMYIFSLVHYYEDVAFFLTDKDAKEYMEYQSHNLTNPRTYAHSCGYSNKGLLPKLMDMLIKIDFSEDTDVRVIEPYFR